MRVSGTVIVQARPEQVWAVIADTARYPRFMAGVTRWESRTAGPTRLGSRWIARLQVGSAPVGALVEVVELDPPCDLAWCSITGVEHRGRWRLREVPGGATRVTFRLAYQAPGGVLGLLADKVSGPMVQRIVDDTVQALRAEVEGRPGGTGRRRSALAQVSDAAAGAALVLSTGAVTPVRPDRLLQAAGALQRWGPTPAAAGAVSAARFPDAIAVVDDGGTLTYRQLHRRTNALARGLRQRYAVGPGTKVGVLCRNHTGFVETCLALSKAGADAVLLNTGFAGPQLADVCHAEQVQLLVHDADLAQVAAAAELPRLVAWPAADPAPGPAIAGQAAAPAVAGQAARPAIAGGAAGRGVDDVAGGWAVTAGVPTLDELVAGADRTDPPAPARPGQVVILTSGTTGRPKGAPRDLAASATSALSLLSRIPYRARATMVIAPPLFHAWGYANLMAALALSSTVVLRRRFDPLVCLSDISTQRARMLVAVPVMLQRLADLPDEQCRGFATDSLQVVAVSGSAIPGGVVTRFMDRFGDVLYNLYGSTEVAWATVADPGQLRAVPTTAGTPPRGTTVAILDDDGIELPRGRRGRIFVGNGLGFSGYSDGGAKTVIGGLIDTGDVGHLDSAGRLMVEGRSDDMIVSGGENVFPQEVEELLRSHPGVADVAVVGVPDPELGQRLAAYVVRRPGAAADEAQLKALVRDQLARHKVPRQVVFVDALPRNPAGKVLRHQLAAAVTNGHRIGGPRPAQP